MSRKSHYNSSIMINTAIETVLISMSTVQLQFYPRSYGYDKLLSNSITFIRNLTSYTSIAIGVTTQINGLDVFSSLRVMSDIKK